MSNEMNPMKVYRTPTKVSPVVGTATTSAWPKEDGDSMDSDETAGSLGLYQQETS